MSDASMPEDGSEQPLIGYRSNEEWQDLMAQAALMVGALDEIEDDETRNKVFAAMAGIDAVHREALHRLVRLFKEGVLEQVITDPAINSLMGMYDLLPPEEPGCAKVWDFIGDDIPDLGTKGVSANEVPDLPHWSPAPTDAVAEEGAAYICDLDEGRILLIRLEGVDYALDGTCPTHAVSLEKGRLDGVMWHCPMGPGCSYDVRSGKRLGGGEGLQAFAVRVESDGRRMIGFGMPFEPKLPAF
jgi:nitrite reductase/ring-hydroxylating ferredoxin subunit